MGISCPLTPHSCFMCCAQSFGETWSLAIAVWIFLGFNPVFMSSPVNQYIFAASGVDLRSMNWTALDAAYYNSTQFLVDVSVGAGGEGHVPTLYRDAEGSEQLSCAT